jgi:hypothetical protein
MAQPHRSSTVRATIGALMLIGAVAAPGLLAVPFFAAPTTQAWSVVAGSSRGTADPSAVAAVLLLSVVLLAGGWAWLVLCVSVEVALQCRRTVRPPLAVSAPRWRPVLVRSLVAALLGTVAFVPVGAEAGQRPGVPAALDGLPVPDRLPGRVLPPTPEGRSRAAGTVRVQPGDTLWAIAADRLPVRASAETVDRLWRRLYHRNRSVVGPDPDLLLPGMLLRVGTAPDPRR